MAVIDIEAFSERAAIMEFDGGLSRFRAETEAARAQGHQRHEVLNEIQRRNSKRARDCGSATNGDTANDVSRMQPSPEEQGRPMPERDVQGGRDRVELLALPMVGGRVL